jgi:cellulose biosynthesis protein BcsQ
MRVVHTAISRRAAFERAAGRGMGVVEMEPHSTAAEEMWALARELNLVNGARG